MLIGFQLQHLKEKQLKKETTTITLETLMVIIPFRNEAENLNQLIRDIEAQTCFPKTFLFVDDHSEDDGQHVLQKMDSKINFELLTLPENELGKKAAIRYAINHLIGEYVLTWDADIRIAPNYFEAIQKLPKRDLYVLPVLMKGKNPLELFFEADHAYANAVNCSVSGWTRPFLASGANLLFDQHQFAKNDSISMHRHIASGDDVFLLRDFVTNRSAIALVTSLDSSVSTGSPTSWKEFLNQRLRWISKGRQVGDPLSNSLALLSLLINIIYFSWLIYFLSQEKWRSLLFLFCVKNGLDLIAYFPFFLKTKRYCAYALIPLFSIFHPMYLMVLAISLPFQQVNWKGRNIGKKK
jgi:poly-beta-1,6-N-acetyl-D-glucosamine synthase